MTCASEVILLITTPSGAKGQADRVPKIASASWRDVARFWSYVDQSAGPDGCWPWKRRPNSDGYGTFTVAGRTIGAHRVACMLAHGSPVLPDAQACHSPKCTTRLCCNPDHLRWDSAAGNQSDVATVGSRRGERNPVARLTDDLARQIWSRRDSGPTAIARSLGLPIEAVKAVCHGRTWRHVTQAVVS